MNPQTSKASLGFWLYLMSDLMLFAALFATFMILRPGTNGGPDGAELFSLPYVLVETLVLLASSLTCGIAFVASRHNKRHTVVGALIVTIALGLTFLALELNEFAELARDGHDWQSSAFLSGFFTLVGTHGLHIAVGLLWAIMLTAYVLRRGLTTHAIRKIGLFALFWHFLDLVWIFIFSVVYLLGVV